eukprot:13502-Heterococcus_DN1.PRE.6
MPTDFTRPVPQRRRSSSHAGDSKADGTTDAEEPVVALATKKLQAAVIAHAKGIAPSSTAVAQQHHIAYDAGRGVWHLLAEGSPDPGIPAASKEQRLPSDASCASTQPASPQALAEQTPALLKRVDTDEALQQGYEGGASAPVNRQTSKAVSESAATATTDLSPGKVAIANDAVTVSSAASVQDVDAARIAAAVPAQSHASQCDEASTINDEKHVAVLNSTGTPPAAMRPSEQNTAAACTDAKCSGAASSGEPCVMWRGEAVAMPTVTVTLWNHCSVADKTNAEIERPLVAESKDSEPENMQTKDSLDSSNVTGASARQASSATAVQYFLTEPYLGPLACSTTATVIRQWDSSSNSESKAQAKASSSNSNSDEPQALTMPIHVPKKRKPSGAAAVKRDSKSLLDSKACSDGADDKSSSGDELIAESKGDDRANMRNSAGKHVDSRHRQSYDADDYK